MDRMNIHREILIEYIINKYGVYAWSEYWGALRDYLIGKLNYFKYQITSF